MKLYVAVLCNVEMFQELYKKQYFVCSLAEMLDQVFCA